jgi:hypothetical protein
VTLNLISPTLGHPPPISLCPCVGVITNTLIQIKKLMGQRGDEGGGGVKGVWHFVEVYFAVILLCFQVVSGGNFYGNFFGLMTQDEKVLCRTPSKKRVMATNGNTMDNGYGKEGGRHSAAATMAMGMSMAQRTQSLVLRLEREG